MTRSLEDPTFAGRVESVETDLAYRVEFDGRSTETYHVRSSNTPSWCGPTPSSVFPAYTALEPKTVEDIRHVTAVEGTELTLLCRLNKDVATARLVDEKGQAIELDPRSSRRAPRLPRDLHARRPAAASRSSWSTGGPDQQAGRRDRA